VPQPNDPFADLPAVKSKRRVQATGDIDLNDSASADSSDPFADIPVSADAKTQVKGGLQQITGAFKSPLAAAAAIVKGIGTSARDTFKPAIGSGEMPGSTRFGDEGAIERSRTNFRVTKENTPSAIPQKEQNLAAVNTAVNLALPAVGKLGILARLGVNTGLGAINDAEQPLRGATAGLVLGEVLHTGGKVVGKGFARLRAKPMLGPEEAPKPVKNEMSPRRRTGDQIPMKYRRAIEPKPDAEGVSFGNTPLEELTDSQLAVRARLAEDLGVRRAAIGEIRRRKAAPPDPGATPPNPADNEPAPVEPPAEAATASFPVEEPGVKPVAVAGRSFEARPGVVRRVNQNKPALPAGEVAPPEATPETPAAPAPAPAPADVVAEQPAPEPATEPAKVERGRKAPDRFDSARTPNGNLRPFHRVSDDGLIRELSEYQAKIVDAQQRAQYNWRQDENFHSTEDGRAVASATRRGGKGVSEQAKALQNLKDYSRIMGEIDAELESRGHTSDSVFQRQQHLAELDAALERDALTHADSMIESDAAFDVVDEPPPDPFADLRSKLEESENRRAEAERDAHTDALTGIGNRRAFDRAAPKAEADPHTSIVRLDLNGMKAANDQIGHAAGDELIKAAAQAVHTAAHEFGIPDRAFRVGGDEFNAIVPKDQAEAFRNRVEELYGVRDHGNGVRSSLSGGIGETDLLADQAAYERKAIHKAEQNISSGRDPAPARAKRDYLNYDKFGLDQTNETRVRAAVEKGRAEGTIDKGKKTFAEQRAEAEAFAKKLVANPLDIDRNKLKNLSGAEIVGLHTVVGENTKIIEATSRAINSGELSPAELADAHSVLDRANKSTNEALATIVREKAETARGLGFFRQVARQSTDPEVWLVHAKKMLGDKPMSDAVMLKIRKLAEEATNACG
jgi:GGDEF domain-containing protein